MTTFISYSRRQLYFAESLALHLQKEGIDVWFDLQQLQAGSVWADGLSDGIAEADRLVLVVSEAALASTYTRDEWMGVAKRGGELILVINEAVELPEELQGLPSYDCRTGFDGKLKQLLGYLKGTAEPGYDKVSAPERIGFSLHSPAAVWCTLLALAAPIVAGLIGLGLAYILEDPKTASSELGDTWQLYFVLIIMGLSILTGARHIPRLLRHQLEYAKMKRAVFFNLPLLILLLFALLFVSHQGSPVPVPLLGAFFAFTLFVSTIVVSRSASLLRWMQPEEGLQKLRLRVHQPLVAKATFDLAAAVEQDSKPFSYTIIADPADQPFAQYVEKLFTTEGHTLVTADASPEHQVAILSNRSSDAWVQKVTEAHAGNIVFIVTSTIEFKESLKETGRYQWVDARDGGGQDLLGLARSLGGSETRKREAALQATPAMIDHWKVPTVITVQKRVLEIFAIFLLVFGITDLVGFVMEVMGYTSSDGKGSVPRSALLVSLGFICVWLAGKAFVYRKIAPPLLYGMIVGGVVLVSFFASLPGEPWFPQAFILPIILFCLPGSLRWLPAPAKQHTDEVGIKKSIDRAFKKRTLIVMAAWIIVIVALAIAIQIKWGPV